ADPNGRRRSKYASRSRDDPQTRLSIPNLVARRLGAGTLGWIKRTQLICRVAPGASVVAAQLVAADRGDDALLSLLTERSVVREEQDGGDDQPDTAESDEGLPVPESKP